MWFGFTKTTVYGVFITIEITTTCNIYLDMLEQFLDPQLQQNVFQQDGAPPHFALVVRTYVNQLYPNRQIGNGLPWIEPLHSPGLMPLRHFFAWGFIKSRLYDLQELKNCIWESAIEISDDMLTNIFRFIFEFGHNVFEMISQVEPQWITNYLS